MAEQQFGASMSAIKGLNPHVPIQDNHVAAHTKNDGKVTLLALSIISATAFVSMILLSAFIFTALTISLLVITGVAALALGLACSICNDTFPTATYRPYQRAYRRQVIATPIRPYKPIVFRNRPLVRYAPVINRYRPHHFPRHAPAINRYRPHHFTRHAPVINRNRITPGYRRSR